MGVLLPEDSETREERNDQQHNDEGKYNNHAHDKE